MIKPKTILDVGLEDISLYVSIKRSSITKLATFPELFSCAKVIGCFISQEDAATMIVTNNYRDQHRKEGF